MAKRKSTKQTALQSKSQPKQSRPPLAQSTRSEQRLSSCKRVNKKREASAGSLLDKYVADYWAMFPNCKELEQQVNEQMAAYEEMEKKRAAEREARRGKPDEEGFVTVIRSSKQKQTDEAVLDAHDPCTPQDGLKRQKKSDVVLSNFYRFQKTEAKKNQLNELQRKFDQDKLRIAELKRSKIFNMQP